ncbi:putative receptor-like protein kinase At3g47110 [Quercus lobata]|uniref:putative receptor-like protein kinase At3g47110 n=1 Tax=Quercus lobata TaxID=97700 RepID=UPI0012482A24|nr:putative receptor-like protein kinase At3g47110 [Quercus lobata]XP_030929088.1 putative receptor-like protein kinase At3g47110 [Quercus lobata]
MTLHQTKICAFCSIYLRVILLFSAISLLCLQPVAITATAPTNETDRLALLKFKELIPHDPYKILSSWNGSMHFCNWHGITCGRRHQRVTGLDLQGYNLGGSMSPAIGNLSFLRFINLQNNSFYGKIPQEFGHLFRLQRLYLNNNTLGGEIPSNLSICSNLRSIRLYVNKLTGKIPEELGSLMRLQRLEISTNNLAGGIPPSLGNLSSLKYFFVGGNNLVGNIPDTIGQLKGLVSFSIGRNKLSGVLPTSISNLSTQLTGLYIGDNGISGTIPASLENLVNLIVLGLDYNYFTGIVPTNFGKFQKVQLLALRGNRLSGEIPTIIGNLTQLFKLLLEENRFEGTIPPTIVNCQNLQYLGISQNNLGGSIPQQLIGPSFPALIYLNLSHNSFTGKLPFEVGDLKNINFLDFSNNNLSGEIPTSIGNCLMLGLLDLHGNSFEGVIPSSMASLKSLQLLDVSQNNLSGSIPRGLEKLRYLENLNLSFNNFEGEVPIEGVFKNTSVISLVGNTKLCGGIPKLQLPKCLVEVMKPRNSFGHKLAIVIISIVLFLFLFSSILVIYWMKKSKKKSPSMFSTMDLLPSVSYQDLYHATCGFSSDNLIGSGSFGSVYKGTLVQEEKLVAIKVLNLQHKGAFKSFMAECNALRIIRHRNLVKILTCCSSTDYSGNQFKGLVFEFMANGSLDIWLHPELDNENQSRNLSLLQRINVALDVAFAIDYLHNYSVQPIIHCDLKPSNVLLDKDMVAHVSDFGLAKLLSTVDDSSEKQTSTIGIKGTIGYAAPEYGMGDKASIEGDVYSYGILLLEMFLGKRPTDEMFKDGLNLHNFAKIGLPERVVQIVDPILLPREVDVVPTAIVATREDNNDNEIQVDEGARGIANLCQMDANVHKFLVSILEIGLACSIESPKERMKMKEVTSELHMIKKAFLGSGILPGGRGRIQV